VSGTSKLVELAEHAERLRAVAAQQTRSDSLDQGGGGPHDPTMEHRLTALETRIDTILPTLATKADVSDAKSSIVMWLSGTVFAAAAITIAVLLFALNRIGPSIGPTSQPIVIQLPAGSSAAVPAPSTVAPSPSK